MVKEPTYPCRRCKTQVGSLGQEDPQKEGMVTLSSILAWRIPMDQGAWQAIVCGVTKSLTRLKGLSTYTCKVYILMML